MARIDPQQLQERFDRLSSILGDIVTQADDQATERCPYRDRHDLCTAKFRCRNQTEPDRNQTKPDRDQVGRRTGRIRPQQQTAAGQHTLMQEEIAVFGCGHDGRFDYRSAWESDPIAVERAREKVARTKGTASSRAPGEREQDG